MAHTKYTIFDLSTGRIIGRGLCQAKHVPAPKQGKGVVEFTADPQRDKIVHDGLDADGKPINPRAVPTDLPPVTVLPELPPEQRAITIRRGQWDELLARVASLETEIGRRGA